MKNYYCKKCGYKNVYQLDLPKFCGSCGVEMQKVDKASCQKPHKKMKRSISVEDVDFYDDDEEFRGGGSSKNPFSQDSFSLMANGPAVQTLGQLKESGGPVREELKFNRPKDNRSPEEIMNEFKREASSKSNSNEIGG